MVGQPLSASVVPHTCSGCSQIYWIVESTSAAKSGNVTVTIKVTQGSTTIFSFSGSSGINLPPGNIAAIWYSGVTFTGAKTGLAKITVTNSIGSVKSSASTTILLK